MSVTHLAGPVVYIATDHRTIQRCAVCGEKLVDSLNMAGPLNPDGTPPDVGVWPEAHYVHCVGNRTTTGEPFTDKKIPNPIDFCLELVE